MAFMRIYIEPTPGFGFEGGPEFSTNVKSLQSGREKRNGDWMEARHRYTAPFLNIDEDSYRSIKDVFLVCRGKLNTFLHRDWADYEAVNQVVGFGDGTISDFQLTKVSKVGLFSYTRRINKPRAGVLVRADGVLLDPQHDYSVNIDTGILHFTNPPQENVDLRWTGEFDVQVRFDNDYLPWTLNDRNNNGYVTNGSVDLIEAIDE